MHWLTNIGTDKLQIVTSTGATIDVVASYADNNAGAITEGRQLTAISSAATTDVLATPSASTIRKIKELTARNKDASLSSNVTVVYNANGTSYEIIKVTLTPGQTLEYVEGIGFFVVTGTVPTLRNFSTGSQTPFSSDTYLPGSNISIPSGAPIAGTCYHLVFDVVKTAAGTATPIITIRFGTGGSTADTSRCAFTFGAGTAAADTGVFDIWCVFRTVGSGTAAVIEGNAALTSNLTTTGLSNVVKAIQTTGGGFDSTVASSIIGASYNGGASAAHTVQLVRAELIV